MREIEQSSSGSSLSELNETILATRSGPEPAEFGALREQYPKSTFTWYPISGAYVASPQLDELYKKATILLTLDIVPLPAQVPLLKLVQLSSAGYDHILGEQLFKDLDINFATASGVHGPQITEHVFMTLLSLNHHFPLLLSWQRSHNSWHESRLPPMQDLVSQRIGILGYGSIGRQVGRVAQGFGMCIHAYTASARHTADSKRDTGYIVPGTGDPDGVFPNKWFSGTSRAELHEFLGSGLDVLVVALPLTAQTRNLLSTAEFEILSLPRPKTGEGAIVVNISRGAIIDHDALLVALKKEKGGLRGASLDVTEPEPLPEESELWDLENVVLTPHISGNSTSYAERVVGILALNLERIRTGGRFEGFPVNASV
ncbi:hypothetical protein Q9L58_004690 [Maublancomyces gigas]|uniref:D-isomer specific 2-hydroxyacid dehydrogenase NAD-binding domain-containing protein n=1 Tax=Discina gigas TaxID=1032678 RepID=A0ABR3GK75_9PEZI